MKASFLTNLSAADLLQVDNQFYQRHVIKDGIFAEVDDVDFDVISVQKRVIRSRLQFIAMEESPPLIFCLDKEHSTKKTEIETCNVSQGILHLKVLKCNIYFAEEMPKGFNFIVDNLCC